MMLWWVRSIILSVISALFLIWGAKELSRAYALPHPGEFLASFFSSSFIILISASLLLGFIWRMVIKYKKIKESKTALGK